MTSDLAYKDENSIEEKDQSNDIVNIKDLDSDDVPIGQRLAPGIAKGLKNRKGQAIESSSTPSKSPRKRASVGPTKRWRKVVTPVSMKKSLKRKEVPSESSDSDHDAEHNVQDIVSTARKLALERELGKNAFECKEVISLIQEDGLMKTPTGFGKCYEILVKEFIVNISKECDNKRSKEFRKVEIITKQVKEWTRKGKLSATSLSVKYVILHKIGVANWVPTNHISSIATRLGKFIYIVGTKSSFDFGSYVFDKIMKHVASYAVKMLNVFSSLICGVIMSQHPSILINFNSVYKRDHPLSLHYRLFTRKHVPDIVMTSGQTSSRPTTRTCILVELKDTCKTLNETIKSST
ncbi:uncharacterized protein LOC127114961 [Lathyrus oleraceus]|uniref:uncharacterized protein LOC127114961 n=1 Tax=Pisum sativum TaxID=3888 RepID=UPI0021D039DF|nr:uncharacterized protein LOC127114961 [Pisum sativum]